MCVNDWYGGGGSEGGGGGCFHGYVGGHHHRPARGGKPVAGGQCVVGGVSDWVGGWWEEGEPAFLGVYAEDHRHRGVPSYRRPAY